MGILSPRCITSDPSTTTLYGLSYAFNQTQQHQLLFVLFQSQPNPSNLTDVRWSVVSTFPGSLYRPDMVNREADGFSCAVTAKGVFTAFASYSKSTPGTEEEALKGLRYDPAGSVMDPTFGVQEGGRWSVVDVARDYNRTVTPRFSGQKLYVVGDGPDRRLVHAYVDEVAGFIRFGFVDETGSRPTLTYNSSYPGTNLQLSRKTTIAFEKNTNQLFIYSPATDKNASVPILASIPLVNGTIPPPSGFRLYEASSTYDCRYSATVLSATHEGSYFLNCNAPDFQTIGIRSQLATLKTPATNTTIQPIISYISAFLGPYEPTLFQPIGGHLPTQTAFAVLMSDHTVAEINLVTGQTQLSLNVIVNGTLDGNEATPSNYPSPLNSGSGMHIVLGLMGSIIYVIVLIFLCRMEKKRGKWKRNSAETDEDEAPRRPAEVDAGSIELGDRRRTEYRHSQDDDMAPVDPPPVYEPRGRDAQATASTLPPPPPPPV